MSLVNCAQCGKKIARDAISCPNCGTNSPHKKKKGCIGRIIFAIVVAGILYAVLVALENI